MIASNQGLAAAVVTAVAFVALVAVLPMLIGTAISVARLEPAGRWNALGIGLIVSVIIAGVSVELFGLEAGLLAGGVGVVGGGVLGGIIGALVRALRRRAASG